METVQREAQVYRNDQVGVTVYKAWYMGQPVALKCVKHYTLDTANSAVREAMTTSRVQHPYICKVLTCSIDKTADGDFETSLVTEWMDGGDLIQDIKRRIPTNCYWTNQELRWHMYKLVEALSIAQQLCIAHRDIKPQNILCNSLGEVKITDFGSSLINFDGHLISTLQGSPFYLSPELKLIYMKSGGVVGQVQHDPYRSDVYSLGLSLLQMARLQEPQELMDLNMLEEKTNQVLGELLYDQDITHFLGLMLRVNNRPDFQELYQCMKQCYYPPAPEPAIQAHQTPPVQQEAYVSPPQHHSQYIAQEDSPVSQAVPAPQTNVQQIKWEFIPSCVICEMPISQEKEWRHYMSEKYRPHSALFGYVCQPDCLDEFIRRKEKEEEKKQETACGLCGVQVTDTHDAFTLACDHHICGWECLVNTLHKHPEVLRCKCGTAISKKIRKKVLKMCMKPRHDACLICRNDTKREAACHHPYCAECADRESIKLTKKCPLC